jgi:hypothetical protein
MPYGDDLTVMSEKVGGRQPSEMKPAPADNLGISVKFLNADGLNPALTPIVKRESGGKPFVGYTPPGQPLVDLSKAPLDETGFPIWEGNIDPTTGRRSHAAGLAQIQPGTWHPIAKQLGIKDFSIESQIAVANELHKQQGEKPWAASAGGGGYGKDPVTGSGKWNVSPNAVTFAQGQPDSDVVWMSPSEYKGMLKSTGASVKRSSLLKNLGLGQGIEEIPEIELSETKGGRALIKGHDGWNRADLAEKEGVDIIPVRVRRTGKSAPEWIEDEYGNVRPFNFTPVPNRRLKGTGPEGGIAEQFVSGVRDVAGGATQLAEHMMPASVVSAINDLNNTLQAAGAPFARVPSGGVDQMERERNATIEVERKARGETGTDWARLAGNVAGTAPLAVVGGPAGVAGAIGAGVAAGGLAGAMAPVTEGQFWPEKAQQIGYGAAAGGAVAGAGNAIRSFIAPQLSDAVNKLTAMGVRLTPGRMMGETASRIEDKLNSLPLIGDVMQSGARRSIRDFNHAIYDKVLSFIGAKADRKTIGYDGVAAVEKKLDAAYEGIKGKIHFQADAEFGNDLRNLAQMVTEMPPGQVEQFKNILHNRVLQRLQPKGYMDGATFKQVESELNGISRQYHASSDAAQRQLADAIDTVNLGLRENLERINPAHRRELRDVNTAWAAFKRLQAAASRRPTSEGILTPGDLLGAEKSLSGKAKFARGDGMLQDIAKDAQHVLPSKYPDSGTTGRLLMDLMVGGGLHTVGALTNPMFWGAAAPLTAGYTAPMMSLMRLWSRPAGPARNVLAQAPRIMGNALAPGAGFIGGARIPSSVP